MGDTGATTKQTDPMGGGGSSEVAGAVGSLRAFPSPLEARSRATFLKERGVVSEMRAKIAAYALPILLIVPSAYLLALIVGGRP